MLFNSYSFIFLFLPITFYGMFLLGKLSHHLAALWLALASLTFYAMWNMQFVLLLLVSIVFNYAAGYWLGLHRNTRYKKYSLVAAISSNLILLAYFKYTNFFIASVNQFFGNDIPLLDIVLPLGISFFTFTQIAFLVDVYRGAAREYNFIHYLLFVTYFPHLIAGPVLHHKQMMPQFAKPSTYHISSEHVSVGLTIFVLGLSKKILIADNLSEFATPIFNAARDGQVLMLAEAWIGALAYSLQLYFDFSAYSDMAIGLSLMFNVRLPMNFNSPYKAISIIDFWRRWHMTLSAFLRDYLYIPLGGNRKGALRRYSNLLATMLLGGLWHGAGWTFIVWGGLHGLYLMINHGWRGLKFHFGWSNGGRLAQVVSGAITFIAVVVAWVFFRADSFTSAWSILSGMSGLNGVSSIRLLEDRFAPLVEHVIPMDVLFNSIPQIHNPGIFAAVSTIGLALALTWLFPNTLQMLASKKPTWDDMMAESLSSPQSDQSTLFEWKPTKMRAILLGLVFASSILFMTKSSEFLYFQF